MQIYIKHGISFLRQRPYHAENTASRPISEVKQRWVWLVLGWETAWEHRMLLAFRFFFLQLFNFENDSNITSTQQNTPSIIYICRFNEFRSNFFSIYLYLKSGWVNIFAFFRSDNYGLTFQ